MAEEQMNDEGKQEQANEYVSKAKPEGAEAKAEVLGAAPAEPTPEVPRVTPSKTGKGSKKVMLLIVLVVVFGLLAVVGGVITGRLAQQRQKEKQQQERVVAATPTPEESDVLTEKYESQSDSDEIGDIEADLENTLFSGIDAELADIDEELSSGE